MMKIKSPERKKLNAKISNLGNYFTDMDEFFKKVEIILGDQSINLVNEDNTPFAGIFCGMEGTCLIDLARDGEMLENKLAFNWYSMEKRIEIVSYIN
jgi:hypothetical protein